MAILDERKPQHYKKKEKNTSVVFRRTTAVVSAIALISSAMLIITSCGSNAENSSSEVEMTYTTKVETTVATTVAPEPVLTLLPGIQDRLNINPDSAGWIKIDGVVDEEIMQRTDAETGNEYYIDHAINGNASDSGVIFADYRSILNGSKTSDNIILYGHNQKDNKRFGTLDSYYWALTGTDPSLTYYKNHALINFNTNYQERQYKIFAIFTTNTEPQHDNGTVFDYINYIDLTDEARYNDYMTNVMDRSFIETGIDVKHGDKFLTLSTCGTQFEGQRLVFVARQVRDGESAEIDFTQSKINSDYKMPAVFN